MMNLTCHGHAWRGAFALALLSVAALPAAAAGGRKEGPVGDDKGAFHVDCQSSHLAPDDPIVSPRQPGHSHLHQFFGNRETGATTTPKSLRLRRETTCARDAELNGTSRPADSSAYWVPVLYVSDVPVPAYQLGAYYSSGPRRFRLIRPFPANLRMIAGDPAGRAGGQVGSQNVISWSCEPGQTLLPGSTTEAPTCKTARLDLSIAFPDCWDGRRSDSRDHRSHMAYSQKAGAGWECPATHPVMVPRLKLSLRYPTTGGPLVKLASGPISTAHGDFMNGWNRRELRQAVVRCLKTDRYCGGGDRPVPGR
jgi:uncharacterized protein DUF1996